MRSTFANVMSRIDPKYLTFGELCTLQVNMGNLCNQRCEHCHIGAGPDGDNVRGRNV